VLIPATSTCDNCGIISTPSYAKAMRCKS